MYPCCPGVHKSSCALSWKTFRQGVMVMQRSRLLGARSDMRSANSTLGTAPVQGARSISFAFLLSHPDVLQFEVIAGWRKGRPVNEFARFSSCRARNRALAEDLFKVTSEGRSTSQGGTAGGTWKELRVLSLSSSLNP